MKVNHCKMSNYPFKEQSLILLYDATTCSETLRQRA